MKWIPSVSALALLLSGCGPSTPSDKDAQAALVRSFEHEVGMGTLDRIDNFGLSGCVKAEESTGVICDVTGKAHLSYMGRTMDVDITNRFRFSKASGEWVAFAE